MAVLRTGACVQRGAGGRSLLVPLSSSCPLLTSLPDHPRCIKFWNSASGALLGSTDTGSQVCSLAWNPHERELLSSHGYSHNQLCLWRFPTMAKVAELSGHSARVLHMAVSPDGTTVVSAAADETLRFWRAFGDAPDKARPRPQTAHGLRSINIR